MLEKTVLIITALFFTLGLLSIPAIADEDQGETQRELEQLQAEHQRKLKKLQDELNRKLAKLQAEYERESDQEDDD